MVKHYDVTLYYESQIEGFRFSIMAKALQLNITGYVRRQLSDCVFIEAEGEEKELEEFIAWCKKGPLGTQITNVDFTEGEVKGFQTFEIQHR